MQWAAPIWLVGLVPWAALAIWLCLGKLPRSAVPFLPLWQGDASQRKPRRQIQWPPLAIICALAAMLLALVAAAQPFSRRLGGSVTVILDRGLSMSATPDGKPRFVETAERLAPYLSNTATIHLIDPLGHATEQLNGSAWLDVIRSKPFTAIDTKTLMSAAVAQTLADGQDPVIVLTDQTIGLQNPRLTVIGPTHAVQDVGIVTVAARASPAMQVMVSVRNQSRADQCILSIHSGEKTVQRKIDLPARGHVANYFIDLPSLEDTVEAQISMQDDLTADDAAWLVRGVQPMRIEIRGLVGDALQRMVQVYSHVKPPNADAPTAAIVNATDQLSAGDAGVVVPPPDHALAAGELRVTPDPLTKVVNWNAAIGGASVSKPPDGDWTPLVTVGNSVLLAKRTSPARQVWVGFSQQAWPKSPDFVVFWTNVLNWVAGDAVQWTAMPVQQLSANWKAIASPPSNVQPNAWPGIYRNGEALLAMNSDVPIFSSDATAPLNLHLPPGTSNHSWSPYFLIAAIGCGILAVATMPRRRGFHSSL